MNTIGKNESQSTASIFGRWLGLLPFVVIVALAVSIPYYFYLTPEGRGERIVLEGKGHLYIDSEPRGMFFIVDEKKIGFTPQTIKDIHAGDHDIVIKRPPEIPPREFLSLYDYEEWKERVRVNDTELVKVNAVLKHRMAGLVLNSSPTGAKVRFDGNDLASLTPIVFDSVRTGGHNLVLTLLGYEDFETTIIVYSPLTEVTVNFP